MNSPRTTLARKLIGEVLDRLIVADTHPLRPGDLDRICGQLADTRALLGPPPRPAQMLTVEACSQFLRGGFQR